MSLLTSGLYPVLASVPGMRDRVDVPPVVDEPGPPTSTYTLTHSGGGWLLLTRRDAAPAGGWSTPLAPHGAGPHAAPRVAQAVGVRVLHELGVDVTGWSPLRTEVDEPAHDFVALTSAGTPSRRAPLGCRGH